VQTNCGNFSGQTNLVEGSKPRNKEDLIELAKQIQQVLYHFLSFFSIA